MAYSHAFKFKVNGQSLLKIEWKQADGQTDGGDRITSLTNAFGKNPEKLQVT